MREPIHFNVRSGWRNLATSPEASGAYLVDLDFGGHRVRVSTVPAEVLDDRGALVGYDGCILNDMCDTEKIDFRGRGYTTSGVSVSIPLDTVPVGEMRTKGVPIQMARARVRWGIVGVGHALSQFQDVVEGRITGLSVDTAANTFTFSVVPDALDGDRPFPPVVASSELISTLDEEAAGLPYPVIFGPAKRVPVFCVNGSTQTLFLVMLDMHGEFTGSKVTTAYEGDVSLGAPAAQTLATDAGGNPYWRIQLGARTSRDITVDVNGYSLTRLADVLRELIFFFTDKGRLLNGESLDKLSRKLQSVELGLVVSQRDTGGVVSFINQRILPQVPVVMLTGTGKIRFVPLDWDRDVDAVLRLGSELIDKRSAPFETPVVDVANSFAVRYARTGLRGEYTGIVLRDWNNDDRCRVSAELYGRRHFDDVDAGDLSTRAGASVMADWLAETHSKVRVEVSYSADLSVSNLQLWDTVQVVDDEDGWDKALFKIVSKTRATGPVCYLGLVSVEDAGRTYTGH
jgi:hypothetical protein